MGFFDWLLKSSVKPQRSPNQPPAPETPKLPVAGNVCFLDIDGVLHPGCSETLKYLPNLYRVLDEHPTFNIVICSNWRETASFEYLQSLFAVSYRHRVVDITPSLSSTPGSDRRGKEIATFLDRNAGIQNWFILDDEPKRYADLAPTRIFATETLIALNDETTEKLIEWIHRNMR